MTQFIREKTVCAICGHENTVHCLTSFSRFGSCALDTRPPELFSFTLFLQDCSHCGYVNTFLNEGDKDTIYLLQSDKYKTCNGINPKSFQAKQFIQYALIQARKKHLNLPYEEDDNPADNEFWGYLNAAWACDDNKNKEDAIKCRKKCLELINPLILSKQETEEQEVLFGIKADLLRRTRQFDALLVEYHNKSFENPYVDQVVRFEIDLAKANDAKKHLMSDIDQTKYPLKEN